MGFLPDTKHGYPADQVISAVQKMVRRGNEEEAYFWALEAEARFQHWLWRRLEIMAMEDIGPANPDAIVQIRALKDTYYELREKREKDGGQPSDLLPLTQAIILLCRSPKSRACDDLLAVGQARWQQEAPGRQREIPDVAKDKHTREGRSMGRGWEHFEEEGTELANEREELNPYRDLAASVRPDLEIQRPGDGPAASRKEPEDAQNGLGL